MSMNSCDCKLRTAEPSYRHAQTFRNAPSSPRIRPGVRRSSISGHKPGMAPGCRFRRACGSRIRTKADVCCLAGTHPVLLLVVCHPRFQGHPRVERSAFWRRAYDGRPRAPLFFAAGVCGGSRGEGKPGFPACGTLCSFRSRSQSKAIAHDVSESLRTEGLTRWLRFVPHWRRSFARTKQHSQGWLVGQ